MAQEHAGEGRALLSTIMETTTSADYEDWRFIRSCRLSNLRNDVECIIEAMESMSANGINAEDVGQSLEKVESMKKDVQDSLDA